MKVNSIGINNYYGLKRQKVKTTLKIRFYGSIFTDHNRQSFIKRNDYV